MSRRLAITRITESANVATFSTSPRSLVICSIRLRKRMSIRAADFPSIARHKCLAGKKILSQCDDTEMGRIATCSLPTEMINAQTIGRAQNRKTSPKKHPRDAMCKSMEILFSEGKDPIPSRQASSAPQPTTPTTAYFVYSLPKQLDVDFHSMKYTPSAARRQMWVR